MVRFEKVIPSSQVFVRTIPQFGVQVSGICVRILLLRPLFEKTVKQPAIYVIYRVWTLSRRVERGKLGF
jgi:hypothetical protein